MPTNPARRREILSAKKKLQKCSSCFWCGFRRAKQSRDLQPRHALNNLRNPRCGQQTEKKVVGRAGTGGLIGRQIATLNICDFHRCTVCVVCRCEIDRAKVILYSPTDWSGLMLRRGSPSLLSLLYGRYFKARFKVLKPSCMRTDTSKRPASFAGN